MLQTDNEFVCANVHELKRRGQGGDPCDPTNTICLCWRCHMDMHPKVGGKTKRIEGKDSRLPLKFFERHGETWREVSSATQ